MRKKIEPLDAAAIGRRIRELREAQGWSQGELARIVGGHTSKVSAWENGERIPEIGAANALAQAFGIPLDKLLTGRWEAPEAVVQLLRDLLDELDAGVENALSHPAPGQPHGEQPRHHYVMTGKGRGRLATAEEIAEAERKMPASKKKAGGQG